MKTWMLMLLAVLVLAAAGAAAQTPAQTPAQTTRPATPTPARSCSSAWAAGRAMATRARGAPRRESPRDRFPARRSRHTFGDRRSGCRTIRRGSSQTSSSGTFTRIYSRVPCRGRLRASRCSSRRLAGRPREHGPALQWGSEFEVSA